MRCRRKRTSATRKSALELSSKPGAHTVARMASLTSTSSTLSSRSWMPSTRRDRADRPPREGGQHVAHGLGLVAVHEQEAAHDERQRQQREDQHQRGAAEAARLEVREQGHQPGAEHTDDAQHDEQDDPARFLPVGMVIGEIAGGRADTPRG
jgi:hypothetical protein